MTRKYTLRRAIFIDGEAVDHEENGITRHQYRLLLSSDGDQYTDYIYGEPLSTERCLDYLLALPPKTVLFSFGMGYDITKWLEDLPHAALSEFQATNTTTYSVNGKTYRVSRVPGRWFIVSLVGHRKSGRRIIDVFGNFQESLVDALRELDIGTLEDREYLAVMKNKRSVFYELPFDQVIDYCKLEARYSVLLFNQLRADSIEAGIVPASYYGAGAMAAKACQIMHIKDYMADPPESARTAIATAFAGGRTDCYMTGRATNLHLYDINSAYSSITYRLPCLAHMNWRRCEQYETGLGLWRVRWHDIDNSWPPFYVRDAKDRLHWPTGGESWVWSTELTYPLALWPNNIEILEGWRLDQECEHTPFARVREWYDIRKEWKKTKPGAARVLKFALNAIFGKTAQTIGENPPYHSFVWAGLITAGIRAALFRAIQQQPEHIIACATDGIVADCELDLPISTELGEWEHNTASVGYFFQPGVYCYLKAPENRKSPRDRWYRRNRGFKTDEISWAKLVRHFRSQLGPYLYDTHPRFVTIGAAIHREDWKQFYGQWVTQHRKISTIHSRRFMSNDGPPPWQCRYWRPEARPKYSSFPYSKDRPDEDIEMNAFRWENARWR